MRFAHQFRDWLAANDPAFSRLRQASRVTLTVVLTFSTLFAIHLVVVPLPDIAYALGILLSIQGGFTVRDKLASEQLVTRLLGGLASVLVVTLAAALEDHRYLTDFAFLLIILVASWIRSLGVRWNAVGMFAFMSYFMGAYFRPALGEIPLVALGSIVSVLVAHGVRAFLLPDDWRRDLLRALESVMGRVNQMLIELAVSMRDGVVSESEHHRALIQSEERLKEAVLMAESFIPRPSEEEAQPSDNPAAEIAMRLFEVHLAAESMMVLGQDSPPSFPLVQGVIEHDGQLIARETAGYEDLEDKSRVETIRAMLWVRDTRDALAETISVGRATDFRSIEGNAAASTRIKWPKFSLHDPAMRLTLQITLATALAMVLGLMLSRERWFWAVLTAFLVFINTNSRGDTAIRALQRSLGTILGIGFGMLLALIVAGHDGIAIAISVVAIFLAFYFVQVSYGAMTFFITVTLCLVYGMTGALTFDVLKLRIGETIIGSATGTAVAFLVFPARTRGAIDAALLTWFDTLRSLMKAASGNGPGLELIQLSQKLDAAYRDATTAAKPLGSSWYIVRRPGHVRQTLAIFMACTYWARVFARNVAFSREDPEGEIGRNIIDNLQKIDAIAPKGSDCFFVARRTPRTAGRHLPLSRAGKRLGIEMIGSMLDRLYP